MFEWNQTNRYIIIDSNIFFSHTNTRTQIHIHRRRFFVGSTRIHCLNENYWGKPRKRGKRAIPRCRCHTHASKEERQMHKHINCFFRAHTKCHLLTLQLMAECQSRGWKGIHPPIVATLISVSSWIYMPTNRREKRKEKKNTTKRTKANMEKKNYSQIIRQSKLNFYYFLLTDAIFGML